VLNESDFQIYMKILSQLNYENKNCVKMKNEKYMVRIQERESPLFSDIRIFRSCDDYRFYRVMGVATSMGTEAEAEAPGIRPFPEL
jgi:hypothetical protein